MSFRPTRACFVANPALGGAGLHAFTVNRNRNHDASRPQAGD